MILMIYSLAAGCRLNLDEYALTEA
jgi:hypothetical protein